MTKKATTNPISSKTKANNCYSRPILYILKWFSLSEVPSLSIATLEEPMSLASQEHQDAQQQ